MPSQIPTKPHINGCQDGYHCIGSSMTLSVAGSTVEDDLTVDYIYYISSDKRNFTKTSPVVYDMVPDAQYWWYAVAVSKNHIGEVFGTSEPSDVYTFYYNGSGSSKPSYDPSAERKVTIIPTGNVEGISISSDTVCGKLGEFRTVSYTLSDDYDIVDITGDGVTYDGSKITIKIGESDGYVIVEVGKSSGSVNFKLYQYSQFLGNAALLETKVFNDVKVGDEISYQIPDEYAGYYIEYQSSNINNLYLYEFVNDYKSISFVMKESMNIEYEVYIDTISTVLHIYKDNNIIETLYRRNEMNNVNYVVDLSEYLGTDYQFDSYDTYGSTVDVTMDGVNLGYSFNSVGQHAIYVYLKKIPVPCEESTTKSLVGRYFCSSSTGYVFVRDSTSGKIVMNVYVKNGSSLSNETYQFVKFNGDENDFLFDDEKYQVWVSYDDGRSSYYIQITRDKDKWTVMNYADEVASYEDMSQVLLQ